MLNRQMLSTEIIQRARGMGMTVEVGMDGIVGAEVAFVGEAPGERECAMKLPMVGGSGQLLWAGLKAQGITRQTCYVTNVIKRRLLFADDKAVVPKNEVDNWVGLLHWELQQLPNLRYVVLLGKYALEAMTGQTGILNWRGSVLDGRIGDRPVKFICTINPAMAIREPKLEVVFRFDLGKLNRVITGKFQRPLIESIINPSPDDVMKWCDKMQDERVPIAFDIECYNMETACIGMANEDHRGMCINFRNLNATVFSVQDELMIRRRIQKLFDDPQAQFIAQNGMFDSYWLGCKDRLRAPRLWMDTLLAHHTLYSQLPHSLGFLTSQYTDHPFYKDDGKSWKLSGDIDQFWHYNVTDCCITRMVSTSLLNELRSAKMDDFFFNHVMRLQRELVGMTVHGIRVDTELKEVIASTMEEHVSALREDFRKAVHEATGDPEYNPSPNSWQQLSQLFFTKLKLVGRGTSTNEANRKRMLNHPRTSEAAQRVIRTLNEYAKERKFLSTYANMAIDDDHRVRCEWRQFGTASAPGRLSSAAVMWESGMNMQNQPERAHPMFIADEGYGFVYFDLSQAEARVVAWEAKIESWIEQFEKARLEGGYDCHRALASEMFKIPYDEVPSFDRWDEGKHTLPSGVRHGDVTVRFIAKRCRHGLNYRMGPDRLSETTGLPLSAAVKAYNIYHRITPELRNWWESLANEVKETRTLYNAMGRRLIVLERVTDEALESIVAFKPQSLIGDKVCSVIYKSHSDPEWPTNARVVLNIHDALIAMAPLDQRMQCLRIMKKHAESPIYIHGRPLIIPADCKISVPSTWMKDEEGHHITYTPSELGVHRWHGMKAVDVV